MITKFKIFEAQISYEDQDKYVKRKSDGMIGQIQYKTKTGDFHDRDSEIRYYIKFGEHSDYYKREDFEFPTIGEIVLYLDAQKYNL